jgi:hypothetical protein
MTATYIVQTQCKKKETREKKHKGKAGEKKRDNVDTTAPRWTQRSRAPNQKRKRKNKPGWLGRQQAAQCRHNVREKKQERRNTRKETFTDEHKTHAREKWRSTEVERTTVST